MPVWQRYKKPSFQNLSFAHIFTINLFVNMFSIYYFFIAGFCHWTSARWQSIQKYQFSYMSKFLKAYMCYSVKLLFLRIITMARTKKHFCNWKMCQTKLKQLQNYLFLVSFPIIGLLNKSEKQGRSSSHEGYTIFRKCVKETSNLTHESQITNHWFKPD